MTVVYLAPCSFFFFQAEDGIRDLTVTGVQTCALPISMPPSAGRQRAERARTLADRRARPHRLPPRPLRHFRRQIGRASCRERVEISVVAVSLKEKKKTEHRE